MEVVSYIMLGLAAMLAGIISFLLLVQGAEKGNQTVKRRMRRRAAAADVEQRSTSARLNDTWRTLLPLAFVVSALVVLLLTPFWVQR